MSTLSLQNYAAAISRRTMMDRRIDAAVQAGSIQATDATALETALDSIDSSLSSAGSSSSSATQSRLDPSAMKDRIDSLIEDQVTAGTLTEDQAATLQAFFAQGGPNGASGSSESTEVAGIDSTGGVGGPGPMRGPPPPPPSGSDSDDDEDDDTSTTSTSSSVADQLGTVISFLENLRSSLTSSTYGTTAQESSNTGLVIDSLA